ncbi:MAG TPA: response regulator transcription factor [Actinomycetota bacterium]|nr:response regulator transcription factor [Actinomycetota bacterium]
MKVLLVDDNDDARFLLRKRIEGRRGFEIVGEAASGEQALEMVEVLSPELVIMDVKMPGIGGVEATRRIKEISATTVVLAYSAYDDAEVVESMRAAGATGYVLKDAPQSELIMRLQDSSLGKTDPVSR